MIKSRKNAQSYGSGLEISLLRMSRFSAKLFIKNFFCPQKSAGEVCDATISYILHPNFTHFFKYLKTFHLLLVISCHREITDLYQYPLYIALWSKQRDKVIMLDSNHRFLESNWFGINFLDLLSNDSSIPRGDSYYLEFWALCL